MEAHERVNESAAVILACQDAADVQAADADDINHICSHVWDQWLFCLGPVAVLGALCTLSGHKPTETLVPWFHSQPG